MIELKCRHSKVQIACISISNRYKMKPKNRSTVTTKKNWCNTVATCSIYKWMINDFIRYTKHISYLNVAMIMNNNFRINKEQGNKHE